VRLNCAGPGRPQARPVLEGTGLQFLVVVSWVGLPWLQDCAPPSSVFARVCALALFLSISVWVFS
jgi:hypothetical protein